MYNIAKSKNLPCDNALRGLFPPAICDWCVDVCKSKTAWRDAKCDKTHSATPCREASATQCSSSLHELSDVNLPDSSSDSFDSSRPRTSLADFASNSLSESSTPQMPCSYTVLRSLSIRAIARMHDVSPESILKRNKLPNARQGVVDVPLPVSVILRC